MRPEERFARRPRIRQDAANRQPGEVGGFQHDAGVPARATDRDDQGSR